MRYILRRPTTVRVPKKARFKKGISHFAIRILTLFIYHAELTTSACVTWKEFAEALNLRDGHLIYDMFWWQEMLDQAGSGLWSFKGLEKDWEAIPVLTGIKCSGRARTITLEFHEKFKEWLEENSSEFSWVPLSEQQVLEGTKSTLAHILFCSLERINSDTLRTLTYKEFSDQIHLDNALPNGQKSREVLRLVHRVSRLTHLDVKATPIKTGRSITAYLLKTRRRSGPKPYLKLSARGLKA